MGYEENLRVLIVEDVEAIRHNISSALRLLGYGNVVAVANGKAAYDFLEANTVDVILSDWYMEPIDGLTLLRLARAHPAHAGAVFVMLSGETAREKIVQAMTSGIDGYIVKPFTLNSLAIKLHEALRRRQRV